MNLGRKPIQKSGSDNQSSAIARLRGAQAARCANDSRDNERLAIGCRTHSSTISDKGRIERKTTW